MTAHPAQPPHPARRALRILLVDDEAALRLTLAANLEGEGFEVVEAESAERALEVLGSETEAFDLVLSDVRMPGMNGVELFLRTKAIRPDTPVVLVTAFALEELVQRAVREGVFAVLSKPYDLGVLMQVMLLAARRPAVLVVDDVHGDAEATALALQAAGVRAQAAYDAEQALQAVRGGAIDVCVLDLVMPGASGPEVLQRIREMDGGVAFIAVSGYSVPELMNQAAGGGAVACMRKPFDPDDLLRVIARTRAEAGRGGR